MFKNKIIIISVLAIMSIINCVSCSKQESKIEIDPANAITLNYTTILKEQGFVEPVVLNGLPSRVVAMSNMPVMVLYELGIEMVGVPKTVVVDFPEDLLQKATTLDVAMNANFDIETVVALNPDLVILGKTHVNGYGKILTDARIPVYYVDDGHMVSYSSAKATVEELIKSFGADNPKGEAILSRYSELEERLITQREKNKGRSIMILQSAPPIHYIQASGGTLGGMLYMLGFDNVYTNERTPLVPLDMEQALSYNPDLFFSIGVANTSEEVQSIMEADRAKNPAYWSEISAIADGRIIYLPVGFISSGGLDIIDKMHTLIEIVDNF